MPPGAIWETSLADLDAVAIASRRTSGKPYERDVTEEEVALGKKALADLKLPRMTDEHLAEVRRKVLSADGG